MNIILLGAPGSGKGTQAELISKEYDIDIISTGEIFRSAVSSGSDLGKKAKEYMDAGELVPDSIVIGIVEEEIIKDKYKSGFILDGFPRTLIQGKEFDKILDKNNIKIDNVILIDVPDDDIIKRMSGRRVHLSSGRTYHILFKPPQVEGRDDLTGEPLIQRKDDKEETVRNRLKVYHKQTAPLIEYYEAKNLLHRIDGTAEIKEIFGKIKEILI